MTGQRKTRLSQLGWGEPTVGLDDQPSLQFLPEAPVGFDDVGYSNWPVGQSKQDVAGASAVDGCRIGNTADVLVNDSTGEHAETWQADSGTQKPEKGAIARRGICGYRAVFMICRQPNGRGLHWQ